MLRNRLLTKTVGAEAGFRWRGGEVSRLEGFSDAVFAFAVTLLVVSLEVPKTYNELIDTMQGFIAFLICFVALIGLWYNHYLFFRRYGLQDRFTIVLNAALLFVMLFFVYPLKFLATMMINHLLYGKTEVLHNGIIEKVIETEHQAATLMVIYDLGFIAIYLVLGLLYLHAYRRRKELELTDLEVFDTQSHCWVNVSMMAVGILSLLIVLLGGEHRTAIAGFIYFIIAPIRTLQGSMYGKRRRKYEGAKEITM